MVGRAEIADELRLWPVGDAVEHVDVQPARRADQGGEQADRPRAGHQEGPGLPGGRAVADPIGVVPGLGEDARRLEQHAQMTQGWVDADRKCGLDPEVFGAVAVELRDAAFGVAAVRSDEHTSELQSLMRISYDVVCFEKTKT